MGRCSRDEGVRGSLGTVGDDGDALGTGVVRLPLFAQRPDGIVLKMPMVTGAGNMMGPNVNTEDTNYFYVMEASFPKSASPAATIELLVDTAATVSLVSPEASQMFQGKPTGYTASGTAAGGEAATAGYQVTLFVALNRSLNLRLPQGLPGDRWRLAT